MSDFINEIKKYSNVAGGSSSNINYIRLNKEGVFMVKKPKEDEVNFGTKFSGVLVMKKSKLFHFDNDNKKVDLSTSEFTSQDSYVENRVETDKKSLGTINEIKSIYGSKESPVKRVEVCYFITKFEDKWEVFAMEFMGASLGTKNEDSTDRLYDYLKAVKGEYKACEAVVTEVTGKESEFNNRKYWRLSLKVLEDVENMVKTEQDRKEFIKVLSETSKMLQAREEIVQNKAMKNQDQYNHKALDPDDIPF